MKGLELSRLFYEEYGAPMLQKEFPHLLPYLAVGLVGSGSECFGFDDALSQDHDFEAGFCLFLPDESVVDRRSAFLLERAYSRLPKEYLGFSRPALSPVGGDRHGVKRIADFLEEKTGTRDGVLTVRDWLTLPEHSLAEIVNGEIFFDPYSELSAVRERLAYLPEAIRRKKLAGNLLMMGQTGQYNYPRCLARGDTAGAGLCAARFLEYALHTVFLLNRRYLPYYKWQFRALRESAKLSELASPLASLVSSPHGNKTAERIEAITRCILKAASAELSLPEAGESAEAFAYRVNDSISDGEIRNLNVLIAV